MRGTVKGASPAAMNALRKRVFEAGGNMQRGVKEMGAGEANIKEYYANRPDLKTFEWKPIRRR